ncbi:MAG: hypothetical protein ACKVOJ_10965 [Sphingomonadaceae bacterium]
MAEWVIAIFAFALIMSVLPVSLAWARKNRKGHMAGAMLGIGMMFASLFDPAKAQATEELDRTNRTGGTSHNAADKP